MTQETLENKIERLKFNLDNLLKYQADCLKDEESQIAFFKQKKLEYEHMINDVKTEIYVCEKLASIYGLGESFIVALKNIVQRLKKE